MQFENSHQNQKNWVSTSNIEPLCSDAAARLRGRPASAQVTSDPAPRKLCSSALNGPTYATYTTDTCTPPQLLHLFYDSKAQIFKGRLAQVGAGAITAAEVEVSEL